MKNLPFREFLTTATEPIVSDGGMATSLYDRGFYINRSFEELSITSPESVREITRGFLRAGSSIVGTNTFGATRPRLTEYNIQDQLEDILRSSVALAQEVATDRSYVVGVMGPLGLILEPLGPTSLNEAQDLFREVAHILESSGVDGFSLRSFHDLHELEVAIQAIRQVSQKPILAHISVQENRKTSFGHTLQEFLTLSEKHDLEVIGLSGDVGPSGMLSCLEIIRPLTKRPISLMPNAGLPRFVNGQYIYLCNPDYMGKFAKRFVTAGANIVGGHSGVHEEHIRSIANALRMTKNMNTSNQSEGFYSRALPPVSDKPKDPIAIDKRSLLGERLTAGQMIGTVEINSPRGLDFTKFLEHCRQLEENGVEFVNIPDGARASARMSSTHLAAYVKQNFKLEPIPHFTTRDRNLLGLQSDLLGAHLNGVRNILAVTGDPPKLGNCPGATGVYDVDAIGLTHILDRMNKGLDLGGTSFGRPTEFMLGVAINPTAANLDLELKRFKYKVEAGADFAITQPIYDLEAYEIFLEKFMKLGGPSIPVIMGIWPLVSLRNAEFLKNEVPGVTVPDWVIKKMEKAAEDKTEALKYGIEIAQETMAKAFASKTIAGFQVSAPFNRVDVALEVLTPYLN